MTRKTYHVVLNLIQSFHTFWRAHVVILFIELFLQVADNHDIWLYHIDIFGISSEGDVVWGYEGSALFALKPVVKDTEQFGQSQLRPGFGRRLQVDLAIDVFVSSVFAVSSRNAS